MTFKYNKKHENNVPWTIKKPQHKITNITRIYDTEDGLVLEKTENDIYIISWDELGYFEIEVENET